MREDMTIGQFDAQLRSILDKKGYLSLLDDEKEGEKATAMYDEGRTPKEAAEELIGIEIEEEDDDYELHDTDRDED